MLFESAFRNKCLPSEWKYANDAKLFYFIKSMEDSATLQKDYSLTKWMETWLLRLNIGKCKAISYSRSPELNTNYSISNVTVENIENM